ncbi:MAG: dockerin type I domain-containing protein, partial [Planctomycetota bacterium]|nr:dockerin type I domain-containing protein [Planctomycetota bacterium]
TDFQKLFAPLYSCANETPSRVPLSDWFTTTDANGRAIGFGDYIQTATGADEAGAWDLRSGAFIQGFGAGTTIADAKLFGDTVVVGLNGPNGGLLAALYDPETLLLNQLPGLTGLTNPELLHGGLSQDASRNLMVAAQTAGGSLVVGGWVTTANPITQLVGAVADTPTLWTGRVIDNLIEVQAVNNQLMLLGQVNDEAAYQAVTLGATPVVNAPVVLSSLVSYMNPATVISAGLLSGVAARADGQIDRYGWSYSPNAKAGLGHAQPQGTKWSLDGVPTALDFVDTQNCQSFVYAVSANGLFAGSDGMTALVGKTGTTSVALPDSTPGWIDAVLATTLDGRYLVGSNGPNAGAWTGDPADLTSYRLMTTAYTAIPNGGTADMFWFVINVQDAFGNDQPLAFGNTTDIATGKDVAAAWNVETGRYYASYGVGTTIADAVVAGAGQTPFVAVNDPLFGGMLMSLDGTNSVLLKDMPGMAALGLTANPFFVPGGLAVDSAGNLLIAATTEDGWGSLIVGGWKVNPVVVNPHPWQNAALPSDVDGQSGVTPLDVLTVINYLNTVGSGPVPAAASGPPYFDVNGDGTVSPIDVLTVINYINNHGGTSSSAEGEVGPAFAVGTNNQPFVGNSFAAANMAGMSWPSPVVLDVSEGTPAGLSSFASPGFSLGDLSESASVISGKSGSAVVCPRAVDSLCRVGIIWSPSVGLDCIPCCSSLSI